MTEIKKKKQSDSVNYNIQIILKIKWNSSYLLLKALQVSSP